MILGIFIILSARNLKNFRENIFYFKGDISSPVKKRVFCIMVGRQSMVLDFGEIA
jgi:hypothetical protein